MSVLALFNPENDLALAHGGKSYTPPPLARAIAHDLSTLPFWYDAPDAAVWLPTLDFAEPLQPAFSVLGIAGRPTVAGAFPHPITACSVWGWSREVAARLERAGVPAALLPDAARLARLRETAHRLHTRDVLLYLSEHGVVVPDELPEPLADEAAVRCFVGQHERAVLKAPWSGSGKGLCWTHGDYDLPTRRWAQGVLHRQGMVIGEACFPKVADFAMEFRSDGQRVDFAGYSFFETDGRGAYKGNLLAADAVIEKRLSAYVGQECLHRVRQALATCFTDRIAPLYIGSFGVDMLIYDTVHGYALHPCVELNLRMNMGMAARLFYDRYVAAGREGIYRVEYFADSRQLAAHHAARLAAAPLRIAGSRIESGYLSLSPVCADTHYCAFVEISPEKL